MTRLLNKLFFLTILSILIVTSCKTLNNKTIIGSEEIIEKSYENKNFSSLYIAVPSNIDIEQGENYSIKIRSNRNFFDHFNVYQNNSTLKILINEETSRLENVTIDIIITMPILDSFKIRGNCQTKIANFSTLDSLVIDSRGHSEIEIVDCNIGDFQLNIEHFSKGVVRNLNVENFDLKCKHYTNVKLYNIKGNKSNIVNEFYSELNINDSDFKILSIANISHAKTLLESVTAETKKVELEGESDFKDNNES